MLDLLTHLTTNIWYVFLIVLFFGGSIFVHELGHFLAARRRGLKIERFSIGFGPKIFAWTRDGVEYRLSWIPLGGYVALPQLADMRGVEGESSTPSEQLPPISYTDKMIVAVMGAVFNLIFAFALATLLWAISQPVSARQLTTRIGYVVPLAEVVKDDGTREPVPSPAVEAGLRVGDVIREIDGRKISDWRDVMHAVMTGSGRSGDGRREARFVIERDGVIETKILHPTRVGEQHLRQVGIASDFDVIVHDVPAGSLAAQIGLKKDDRLVSIAGVPIRNDQTYGDMLMDRPDQSFALVVQRAGQELTLTVPPRPQPTIQAIMKGSIAQEIGLKASDRLVAIDGEPVGDAHAFVETVGAKYAASLKLTVQRGAETKTFTVPAREKNQKIGIVPGHWLGDTTTAPTVWIRVDPFTQFVDVVSETYYTLASLLNRNSDVGVKDMSGPLGIGNVFYQAAREGIHLVLWFTILVNINLAIFNLLPIPVLDGGHMLFATIGKIRGRALPPGFLAATQSVFMVLLLCLVLYVTVFDSRRIVDDIKRPTAVAPEVPAER